MANIDLFVCVIDGTSEYAELTKKISSKLLSNKHNVNWKYIISGSVKRPPDGYELAGKVNFKKKYNVSFNHGVALNEADRLSTEKYVIMLDTDFIFLIKDWDDIIVRNLDNNIVFGVDTPAEVNRAHNFPFIYCFCYRRDLLKNIKLDFRPRVNKDGDNLRFDIVSTERERKVMGMPMGSKYRWETSSRIPFIFYDNNLRSKAITCVLGYSEKVKLPFLTKKDKKKYMQDVKKSKASKEYMEEWHYKGKLFATHLRGSIRHGINGYIPQYWLRRIKEYLKVEYSL